MKRKQLIFGTAAAIGMLVLILDGKTALEGAQTGVELCLKTVIPSLFPFFVLSILLTSSFSGISLPILRPLGKICAVPEGAETILISGFLGGYPVGAQSISSAYRAGYLTKEEAQRLLAFCNNAGPAFLFGMVASMFPRSWMAWVLWGIHILSALFTALLIPRNASHRAAAFPQSTNISLTGTLYSALKVMATVCGWVILFRVLITFLKRWIFWIFPADIQVLLTGLLELSNGCCELHAVTDLRLRFLICSGILAFGGLCVTMQTLSVTSGLSTKCYFGGKFLQTVFSLSISWGILYRNWVPFFLIFLVSFFLLRKKQKRSSIHAAVGV